MQKIILYAIIIIIITGVILAAGWFFFIKDSDIETVNVNTALTNTANVNVPDLPLETEKGDTETNATITYNDTVFVFTSASRVTEWHGETATSGKEFLVVFFSPIDVDVREATAWIRSDANLITGANQTLKPAQLKVVGLGGSSDDTGYLVFEVSPSDENFRVGFKDTIVALGL